jgi:hypothetical protein
MTPLPTPRGPISEFLFAELELGLHEISVRPAVRDDPIEGDDLHLALFVCYELHARGFEGIDGRWEWEPSLLSLRGALEERFEHALCCAVGPIHVDGRTVVEAIDRARTELDSVRAGMHLDPIRARTDLELRLLRAPLRTAQADAYAFGILRLPVPAQRHLPAIGSEARNGRVGPRLAGEPETHGWTERGTRPTEHLARLPGIALAEANLASLFGLHRRHRGALAGHAILAGLSAGGGRKLRRSCAELAEAVLDAEPELAADLVFGARAAIELERRFRQLTTDRWGRGASPLLEGPPSAVIEIPERSAETRILTR